MVHVFRRGKLRAEQLQMLALAISKLQRGRAGLRQAYQAYNGIGSKNRLLTGSIPKKKVGVGVVIGEPVSMGLIPCYAEKYREFLPK